MITQEKLLLPLILIGSGLFVFLIQILLFFVFTRGKEGKRESLRNTFGYEYYRVMKLNRRVFLYVLSAISVLFLGTGAGIFLSFFQSSYAVSTGISFSLALILLTLATLIPLPNYKLHIFTAFSGLGFLGLSGILYSFATILPDVILFKNYFYIPLEVIFGLVGLLSLVSLFNPKLTSFYKMNRAEVNGTVYYEKPKVNSLALTEWFGYYSVYFLGALLLLQIVVIWLSL